MLASSNGPQKDLSDDASGRPSAVGDCPACTRARLLGFPGCSEHAPQSPPGLEPPALDLPDPAELLAAERTREALRAHGQAAARAQAEYEAAMSGPPERNPYLLGEWLKGPRPEISDYHPTPGAERDRLRRVIALESDELRAWQRLERLSRRRILSRRMTLLRLVLSIQVFAWREALAGKQRHARARRQVMPYVHARRLLKSLPAQPGLEGDHTLQRASYALVAAARNLQLRYLARDPKVLGARARLRDGTLRFSATVNAFFLDQYADGPGGWHEVTDYDMTFARGANGLYVLAGGPGQRPLYHPQDDPETLAADLATARARLARLEDWIARPGACASALGTGAADLDETDRLTLIDCALGHLGRGARAPKDDSATLASHRAAHCLWALSARNRGRFTAGRRRIAYTEDGVTFTLHDGFTAPDGSFACHASFSGHTPDDDLAEALAVAFRR